MAFYEVALDSYQKEEKSRATACEMALTLEDQLQ